MKRWYLFCLLLVSLVLGGCAAPACGQDPACTRLLFIGNSYTFVNDLPGTFARLAQSGGKRVETGMAATGGWILSDHLKSADTLEKITSSTWDYIVLQEQSQIPASELFRKAEMYPAARALTVKIREAGATPVFFVTWAHRQGWPEEKLPTYASMQLQIDEGYVRIAEETKTRLAPVGFAWYKLWKQNPQLSLWQEDGSHPNEKGTYLAACVFYATLYKESPEGLNYTGNLPAEEAQVLQKVAAETVLQEPARWNLP
jgi:hypothetical protein